MSNKELFLSQKLGPRKKHYAYETILGREFLDFVREEHPEHYEQYFSQLLNTRV